MSALLPPASRPAGSPWAATGDLIAVLPAIVWEADGVDYCVTYVSPRARDILGHDPARWVSEPMFWESHLHPDDREAAIAGADRAVQSTAATELVYRFRAADGSYRWFRDAIQVVPTPEGGKRLAGVMLDVTAEREAAAGQERTAAERDRMHQAIEQSGESVVFTDRDARIVYVNGAFERLTGYARDEVLGQNPRILQGGEQGPETYRGMWDTLRAGRTWTGELVNRRKDGTRYREHATIAPVLDASGETVGYIGVNHDVTQEREIEKRLAQAGKLNAIGQLSGGIAHDFNNLLTATLGYGELLRPYVAHDREASGYLDQVILAGERAQRLTSHLLAYGRRAALQPRPTDVAALLHELHPLLRRMIPEEIELELDAPGSALASLDPDKLEHCVVNLVVNARDAMAGGGTCRISLSSSRPDGVDGGDWLALRVSDTGSGMDDATLEHLFEPFFTTKPVGAGTGLGLAMVHGFTEQSGGHVRVESTVGAGTAMTLFLPAIGGRSPGVPAPSAPAAVVAQSAPAAVVAGGTPAATILLVDDEALVRTVAQRILERAGYRVLSAPSGEAALALLDEARSPIDLLVTDVVMTGMRGYALADAIREREPGVGILFTSGYDFDSLPPDARGDAAFLAKPYTPDALLAHVASVARRG